MDCTLPGSSVHGILQARILEWVAISISIIMGMLLLSCFSHVRLCDPIDGSPRGSPIPGILQARTLGWVAISFSNAWKWKVKVKLFSRVWLLATPWTAAYQAPPSMGFSRQVYWSGVPLPSPIMGIEVIKTQFFILPPQEHYLSLHLFVSSLISFISVL